MEKETLEEAAENHLQKWRLLNNIHLSNILHAERCKSDFIAGAKYMAERMYSEEEVLDILFKHTEYFAGFGVRLSLTDWFELQKK